MTLASRMTTCSAVLIFAAAVSYPALAAEPQPGLWNQAMTMDMSGMQMPEMPAMPPEVLAQMQAAGIQMPNMDYSQPRTTTNQYCITPEDIANRESFADDFDDDYEQQNLVSNDQGMSMDLVCTGRMNGTGRLEYVFDSATHYTGSMTFEGTMEGRQSNMTNTMEGSWVSADCGNVAP